ncbi:Pre-mRNA-splicing factor CWC22-like isoform D [Glycine soja]|nr:Pre-mRNA-splicing factor CWC22-like isoform D [Glycine soja]
MLGMRLVVELQYDMVMLSSDLEMLYSVTSLSVGSLYFVFLFTLSEVSVDASHLLRVEHWCNIGGSFIEGV